MENDSASLPGGLPITDSSETSEIAEFFNGRSVFITGGAGFVGSILVESLLSYCPGIRHVYLLLREKKGVTAHSRKDAIFQKRIFQSLKKKNPEVFSKVHAIEGDVTSVDLGISCHTLDELKEEVSVVFHCAAAISFTKTLRYMIKQNVIGTENVVNLCRMLPKLVAFVYTSTAYSNCNRMDEIKEEIYPLTLPAKTFINAVKLNEPDDVISNMQRKCVPAWPNTYTLSKAIAEDYLRSEASDIPVAVVRPSIIMTMWKGSMPGYTEEGAGLIDVSLGIGKGFIRVLHCDEDKYVNVVPADGVTNTLITAAWCIATKKMETPLVINCAVGDLDSCTWGQLIDALYTMNQNNPLPKMYQKPDLVKRKYAISYWASALVNHYAPAVCIDLALLAMQKKPKLTKLYRFYDTALSALVFFLTNEWRFSCNNFKHLAELQNENDAELFPVDIRGYTPHSLAEDIKYGAPFYQWEIDNRKYKDRVPLAYRRYVLTTTIKWTFIICLFMMIAYIITIVFPKQPLFDYAIFPIL